jgi:hypothetical protein
MRIWHGLAIFTVCMSAPAPARASQCDFSAVSGWGELSDLLSQRAIQIVSHAATQGWQKDAKLRALMLPDAAFSLGASDVGRPFGQGVEAAHLLAKEIAADSYRYLRYSSIPMQVDPCAEHKITVDFLNTTHGDIATVEFVFRNGLLASASGWSTWFASGKMKL